MKMYVGAITYWRRTQGTTVEVKARRPSMVITCEMFRARAIVRLYFEVGSWHYQHAPGKSLAFSNTRGTPKRTCSICRVYETTTASSSIWPMFAYTELAPRPDGLFHIGPDFVAGTDRET